MKLIKIKQKPCKKKNNNNPKTNKTPLFNKETQKST